MYCSRHTTCIDTVHCGNLFFKCLFCCIQVLLATWATFQWSLCCFEVRRSKLVSVVTLVWTGKAKLITAVQDKRCHSITFANSWSLNSLNAKLAEAKLSTDVCFCSKPRWNHKSLRTGSISSKKFLRERRCSYSVSVPRPLRNLTKSAQNYRLIVYTVQGLLSPKQTLLLDGKGEMSHRTRLLSPLKNW